MLNIRLHKNVIQLYGICLNKNRPILVLELAKGGSLKDFLCKKKLTKSSEALHIIKGIAEGMAHLHEHDVIHRDLAARNILLDENLTAKISDFGLSRELPSRELNITEQKFGPIRYMAPEAIAGEYSRYTDSWSFGITLWEIVAGGKTPHEFVDLEKLAIDIRDKGIYPSIPDGADPIYIKIMKMCWRMNPKERPSFKEICTFLLTVECK